MLKVPIHFRYGPNTCFIYCTMVWHRTYTIRDALLSRSARRKYAALQKSRKNHRSERHEKLSCISWTATAQNWNKSFTHFEQRAGAVDGGLIIGNLSTRRSSYHGRQPEVFLQHDSHCARQDTRGSNSGFFEEYSSYKSRNSSSEIMFSSYKETKLNANL